MYQLLLRGIYRSWFFTERYVHSSAYRLSSKILRLRFAESFTSLLNRQCENGMVGLVPLTGLDRGFETKVKQDAHRSERFAVRGTDCDESAVP